MNLLDLPDDILDYIDSMRTLTGYDVMLYNLFGVVKPSALERVRQGLR